MLQVTVLRGENASAKSLHSIVQTLESDKVKLELKVKNLELQLKENKRQLSSSGKRMPAWCPSSSRSPPMAAWCLLQGASPSRGTLPIRCPAPLPPPLPTLSHKCAWWCCLMLCDCDNTCRTVHDSYHQTSKPQGLKLQSIEENRDHLGGRS